MARLLTCGWETGDINEGGASGPTAGSWTALTVVSSTPTPRLTGAYCLRWQATNFGTFDSLYRQISFATATEVWVRLGFYAATGVPNGAVEFLRLFNASAARQIHLTFTGSDNLIRLMNGSTTLGTASQTCSFDAWHLLEWRVQILTATTGASEVWLDGAKVIDFSGDTSETATLNLAQVGIGSFTSTGGTTGAYLAFDDLAINDTSGSVNNGRVGNGRIVMVRPSADGSSTQLTRGGTDTGANWSQVNEAPFSMTQYVQGSTVADRDLYALGNLPSGSAGVNAVELLILALKSDAGAASIGPTLKSGSTVSEATAVALSVSATLTTTRWETDPATSAAWTASAVDALEAGVTVR